VVTVIDSADDRLHTVQYSSVVQCSEVKCRAPLIGLLHYLFHNFNSNFELS
jgi:hypothetical protein